MSLQRFKEIFKEIRTNNKNIEIGSEFLKPRGEVTIWENEKKDSNILVKDSNLIVKNYFNIIANCLKGDQTYKISKLKIGDGGIIDNVLQTPSFNDTDLYNTVFEKTSVDNIMIENIIDTYISFNFIVGNSEANGTGAQIINEIGLLSENGLMFARKTFSEIVKTSEKELIVEWKLKF